VKVIGVFSLVLLCNKIDWLGDRNGIQLVEIFVPVVSKG